MSSDSEKRDSGSRFGSEGYKPKERESIQQTLAKKLRPEDVSHRSGPGGTLVQYIEGWKSIEIANAVLGFDGWSCSLCEITVDYVESTGGAFDAGVSAIVRITTKSGSYHEDVGYGIATKQRSRGLALQLAKKEAVTDARKRALRLLGNSLGNCVYDKKHMSSIRTGRYDASETVSATSIKAEGYQSGKQTAGQTPAMHASVQGGGGGTPMAASASAARSPAATGSGTTQTPQYVGYAMSRTGPQQQQAPLQQAPQQQVQQRQPQQGQQQQAPPQQAQQAQAQQQQHSLHVQQQNPIQQQTQAVLASSGVSPVHAQAQQMLQQHHDQRMQQQQQQRPAPPGVLSSYQAVLVAGLAGQTPGGQVAGGQIAPGQMAGGQYVQARYGASEPMPQHGYKRPMNEGGWNAPGQGPPAKMYRGH